ncbi:MAG: hypothetical protein ACXVCN_12995 [Bdellovibrio sp.]
MLLDKVTAYLGYQNNILRKMGLVGLKPLHLEANPVVHRRILEKAERKFGPAEKLNNYQRTYAQFFCQESLYENVLQKFLATLLFIPLVPFTFFFLLINSFKPVEKSKCDVFIFAIIDIGYPLKDFDNKKVLSAPLHEIGYFLGFSEILFVLKIFYKIPAIFFSPKLVVNILRWISRYAWVVKKYEPQIVATFFEGAASCSVVTEYLNLRGIQIFNYAHGEHFRYDCYSAYGNFNKYVIWGEHFKKIQIEKRCREEMFITRAPDGFKNYFIESSRKERPEKNMTVLIHSGVYKGSTEYNSLLDMLKVFPSGWNIYLRPHPRDRATWPQVKLDLEQDIVRLNLDVKLFECLPEQSKMLEAIEMSQIFVGSASAALLEALLGGCKIIYLPGRVKNGDIIERHFDSKNVLSLLNGMDAKKIQTFLETKYVVDEVEKEKLKYLFSL